MQTPSRFQSASEPFALDGLLSKHTVQTAVAEKNSFQCNRVQQPLVPNKR